MSRKPRLEFEGAIYHVFQRGNNKEHIFEDSIEKGYFLKQVKDYRSVYNYELLAYVIMGNHYHMILRTNEAALGKIMHRINNSYRRFYNYRRERTGHVFEDRYNSILVHDDAYLIWLIRYIHRNPVRAHMCDDVSKYKWSSDFIYRRGVGSFVNIDIIMDMLSPRRLEARERYFQIMASPDGNRDNDYEGLKEIFPNISFGNAAIKHLEKGTPNRKTLNEIINSIELREEECALIKSGSRKRHLVGLKMLYIKEALKYKYTYKEIGEFIGISQSAVTRILKKVTVT